MGAWVKTWWVEENLDGWNKLYEKSLSAGRSSKTFTLRWPWATHLHIEVALSHKPSHWGGLEPQTFTLRWPWATHLHIEVALSHTPLHWGGLEPQTFTLRWPWATNLYIEVALSHKPLHWGGLEPHTHVSHFRIVVKNLSHSATCIVWYTIYKCLPKTISNKIIHFLIFFISTSQLSNNYKYLLIN